MKNFTSPLGGGLNKPRIQTTGGVDGSRYLTKSRFKLALDCPSKLFYCNKKNEYADAKLDDPFLRELAFGGFQVGELAKYLFCDDPKKEQITIEEKDYDKALELTGEKLFSVENPVIAEAAFRYENLFVRVDITTRQGKVINLYEVKAKSWNSEKTFWKGAKEDNKSLNADWLEYLYDIAFQKYVVSTSLPGYEVHAHLILADCDTPATINGLNQLFRKNTETSSSPINVVEGTIGSSLGKIPLTIIPVDEECKWIYEHDADVDLEEPYSFKDVIKLFSDAYEKDERIWSPIGSKCKHCQFVYEENDSTLKSGFIECWQHATNLTVEQLNSHLVLELWGGRTDKAIDAGIYLLKDLPEEYYWPKKIEDKPGLNAPERKKIQIDKVRRRDNSCYLDKNGLKKVFAELEPPYHFIDFETTMVALPFHAGRKPYEGIAFQYSYHLMDANGNVQHKSQYLSLNQDFPNYDFTRALRKDLENQKGTIFRYHNHENTYLRSIRKQLLKETDGSIPDRYELIAFIDSITHNKGEDWYGSNDMQDLYQLVLSYYYSPFAKGSNSIKQILPAVINDSEFIRAKYSQPIYGTDVMPSLNVENHAWIQEAYEMNPYKTLPRILENYSNESLDEFLSMPNEEIHDGGAAMMAYAYLQFTDIHPHQKELIKNALLRYCELDTMAMVMIWEFFTPQMS